jgi:hypothetical protein
MIKISILFSSVLSQKRQFFLPIFSADFLKIITLTPGRPADPIFYLRILDVVAAVVLVVADVTRVMKPRHVEVRHGELERLGDAPAEADQDEAEVEVDEAHDPGDNSIKKFRTKFTEKNFISVN